MIDVNDVIGYIALCISAIFAVAYKPLKDKVDMLNDAHYAKLKDSSTIAVHESRINTVEKKHETLDQKQSYHYHKTEKEYSQIVEEIKALNILITHKNNGEGQGFNNIANIIKEEMQKLKDEINKAK